MEEQAIQHKWYVVRVKGGQEKKISTYIEKEVNRLDWNEYVTQILVPTEKVYQIRKGKKVSKERNFFPGYVLIEANLIGEIAHTLRALPGVFGFLGEKTGGEPVPMRQSDQGPACLHYPSHRMPLGPNNCHRRVARPDNRHHYSSAIFRWEKCLLADPAFD